MYTVHFVCRIKGIFVLTTSSRLNYFGFSMRVFSYPIFFVLKYVTNVAYFVVGLISNQCFITVDLKWKIKFQITKLPEPTKPLFSFIVFTSLIYML